jgi:transglutaminase-like putative cysteine protease
MNTNMDNPQPSTTRWWDLPAAALLMAALLISAARLIATRWTSELTITQMLVAFGVLAGLALGKSRFSPRLVAFFATVYGAFAVPWQLGLTLREDILWTERLSILINRLGVIIYQLINREPVQDSLLFLLLMSILYWIVGSHAGYTLVRYGNAWKAVIPGGVALFVIHTFDPLIARRTWYLAAYLFFALVLVARMAFLQRESSWQHNRTALPPHLGYDFVRFAVIAALLVVMFAWTAPAMAQALPAVQKAWQPVRDAWNDAKSNFENAFASLRSSVGLVSEVYGDSASLGMGNPLSQAMMFTVDPPDDIPSGTRLYWRARTYDTYSNGRWLSTVNSLHEFDPQESELNVPIAFGRWAGSFMITTATNPGTLFVPAQPLWVNRPGQIEYAENPDGTVDISTFRAVPALQPGQEYEVHASINNATIAQLQEAGEEYPEWVTERYLQLPDTITPRTRRLAEQITADLETPYQKAAAITQFLRENITYVDRLPETPPSDQEIVDWFLFDLRQGFCNYYSTAEIVLLRSIGIPARWSVGYAQGERQNDPGDPILYRVRHRDAHAWPEVYFPGIGWVEFEPTVSQPDIARQAGITPEEEDTNLQVDDLESQRQREEFEREMELLRQQRQTSTPLSAQQNRLNVVYWSLALALGALLVFLVWRMRSRIDLQATPILLERALTRIGIRPPRIIRLWARRAMLPPLSKSYLEINYALARMGKQPVVNETPAERAESLSQALPEARNPADTLVHEYQIAIFSRQPANLVAAISAGKQIRSISLKAFLQRLLTRFQRRPGRSRSRMMR